MSVYIFTEMIDCGDNDIDLIENRVFADKKEAEDYFLEAKQKQGYRVRWVERDEECYYPCIMRAFITNDSTGFSRLLTITKGEVE